MSRQISQEDTLTLNPTGYDEDNHSYASVSGIANAYDGHTSTNYATINLKTGSRAETYVFFTFDTDAIPDGATIESVACQVKVYISRTSTNYVSTRQVQMFAGETAKGSASTVSNSTSVITMSPGSSWTAEEARNARIRIYASRGTSNTSTSTYFRFYGATLTIAYSIEGVMYEVTATSNVTGATVQPASSEVFQGGNAEISISGFDATTMMLTDNGVDVTGQMVEQTGGSASSVPQSYTTSGSISGTYYQSAVGKGSDASNASGNDYCNSSGRTAHIDYAFDFSMIPAVATIDNVTLTAKGHCESTTNSSEVARLQAYSGSTAKGSSVEFESTSDTVLTLNVGTWTRDELQDAILRFTIGYYGGRLVGATWTVQYSVSGHSYTVVGIDADHVIVVSNKATGGLFVKQNGAWVRVEKLYEKQNGVWVEQDPQSYAFNTETKYINGDEA